MTNFAVIESELNTAVLGVMGNATLTWGASSSADGVFRKPSDVLLGDVVQGDQPTFTALTSAIGSLSYGSAVSVNYSAVITNYMVTRNEPDGTGVTVLTLQKV